MARTTYVKKAQASKHSRTCTTCSHEIQPGESYKWMKRKTSQYSSTVNYWCKDHNPLPSQTTTSAHLQTIYAAQEGFEPDSSPGDPADLANALRDVAENAREAVDSYSESADNIEEGFGHETSMSQELREKSEAVESWCDEVSSKADEIESNEFDEQNAHAEALSEVRDNHTDEPLEVESEVIEDEEPKTVMAQDADDETIERAYGDEIQNEIETKRQEWWDDLVSEAQDVVNEGPQV